MKWLKRIFLGFCSLFALLVAIGLSTQALLTKIDASKFAPPGQLVDIGGFKLHLHCTGQGSPTVVLEAGLGSIATSWALVQREVAKTTRVCSYDRAGYGFSDSGPLPRTSQQIAKELHMLLTNAGEKGPFVLAGHSFGGLNVRMFDHAYPSEVAGLLLIDSAVEEALGSKLWMPLYNHLESDSMLLLGRIMGRLGLARLFFPDTLLKSTPFLPEEKAVIKAFSVSTKCGFAFLDESHTLPQSFLQAKNECRTIGDKPLVVIVAGKNPDLEAIAGSKENAETMKQEWTRFQKNLAKLSTRSTYLIAENSAHMIPFEQPEIIVMAIDQMVGDIRANR